MRLNNLPGWVLVTAVALPQAPALAQPGYSFRPMEGADPSASQVPPGWRPGPPAPLTATQAGQEHDHMGYRFAPRQAEPPQVRAPQPLMDGTAASFRYKPDEPGAVQPPPLPTAIDPQQDPAMQAYDPSRQAPGQGMGPGQGRFAPPERPARLEPPPRPGFAMERPHRPAPPARPEPPAMPKPLYLEGRYIDGINRHQQQAYPFRPLEEEKPKDAKTSSGSRPADQASRTGSGHMPGGQAGSYPGYQFPPMPPTPYPPAPYDRGYNNNGTGNGPSFNGFRFPFSNGNFPFNFK